MPWAGDTPGATETSPNSELTSGTKQAGCHRKGTSGRRENRVIMMNRGQGHLKVLASARSAGEVSAGNLGSVHSLVEKI
ncbi:hypothetical protein EYF80_005462 [Liparis tanakae]|uniref:Uncharacterized protein n=1 Tax=Liparis tanakae TaxID=230148 RepID=A0A4Z2J1E1_9TELE|nr:hypothetical protein EYF80_005462 [Liparis tanakae]